MIKYVMALALAAMVWFTNVGNAEALSSDTVFPGDYFKCNAQQMITITPMVKGRLDPARVTVVNMKVRDRIYCPGDGNSMKCEGIEAGEYVMVNSSQISVSVECN